MTPRMKITPEMIERGAALWPIRIGCTCSWDGDGTPIGTCRCKERSDRLVRQRVEKFLDAVLNHSATDGGEPS